MEYLVAVSSRDGVVVHQHFGHTEEFQILRVVDNERYELVEHRPVAPVCNGGQHDEDRMARTVEALSDCKYVLSAQIGRGAQIALQAKGITPLEIAHLIDYAMEKLMLYDQRRRGAKQTNT